MMLNGSGTDHIQPRRLRGGSGSVHSTSSRSGCSATATDSPTMKTCSPNTKFRTLSGAGANGSRRNARSHLPNPQKPVGFLHPACLPVETILFLHSHSFDTSLTSFV